jgi:hypothetical protein
MKPWQLAKMMRVLEVRANLVLIFFSLTKSLPFLSAGVGVSWMCLILMVAFQNGNHFFLEIIGFPLKIDRHENRLYKQHLEIILLNQLSLWCQKITYITNLLFKKKSCIKLNFHQRSPSYGLPGAAAMQFF